MLLQVEIPNEPMNTLVKNGTAGEVVQRILGEVKPSAAYFTEQDGRRGAVVVVDVPDASSIPMVAEPFFLLLDATVKLRICMTPEDLSRSALDEMGQRVA